MPVGVQCTSPDASGSSAESFAGQGLGAGLVDVHDGQVGGAEPEQGVGHGAARAAGAEQDDVLGGRVGQPGGEGRGESGDVGVVADHAAVTQQDGVDRAQRGGPAVDLVQVRQHQLLARMGDVERVVAQSASLLQQVAHRLGRQAQGGEVDRPVHVREAEGPRLRHVQRRREGRPDAGADEADEERVGHGRSGSMY
jgi:hypothetical protein